MRKSWNVISALCGVAFLGVIFAAAQTADARPQYFDTFKGQYQNVMEANKQKCNVCHYGKSKKNRNNFGELFGKTLGQKNVPKDKQEPVKEALTKVESEKSAVEGKTFGDLLKEGKLPAEGFEPKEEDSAAE